MHTHYMRTICLYSMLVYAYHIGCIYYICMILYVCAYAMYMHTMYMSAVLRICRLYCTALFRTVLYMHCTVLYAHTLLCA
jgi:hypothetical protein